MGDRLGEDEKIKGKKYNVNRVHIYKIIKSKISYIKEFSSNYCTEPYIFGKMRVS